MHLLLYLFERFYKPVLTILLVALVDLYGAPADKAFWLAMVTAASLVIAACGPSLDQLYVGRATELLRASPQAFAGPSSGRPVLFTIAARLGVSLLIACGAALVGHVPWAVLAVGLAYALPSMNNGVVVFIGSPLVSSRQRTAFAGAMAAAVAVVVAVAAAAALRTGRVQVLFGGFVVAVCAATLLGNRLLWRAAGPIIAGVHARVAPREVLAIIGASLVGWFSIRIDQFLTVGASAANVDYLLLLRYLDAGWTLLTAFSGFLIFSSAGQGSRDRRAAWAAIGAIVVGAGGFFLFRFGARFGVLSCVLFWVGALNVSFSMLLLARRGGIPVLLKNLTVLASAALWLLWQGRRGPTFTFGLHAAGLLWGLFFLYYRRPRPAAEPA